MKYKIGDRVLHPEYGEGVIICAIDNINDECYKVNYNTKSDWHFELEIDKIIVKDNKMTQITKDNIVAVLKHNGFNMDIRLWKFNTGISIGSKIDEVGYVAVSFGNPYWLQIIEAHLGKKLEPLPESNPFDAVKYEQWVKCVKKVHDSNPLSKTIGRWYQKLHCGKFSSSFSFVGDDGGKWNSHCPVS